MMALSEQSAALTAPALDTGRSGARTRLLATSAFRITALVVAGFVTTAAIVVGILFWQTNNLLTAQVLQNLSQDRAALEEVWRASGPQALTAAVGARSKAPEPGASLLILLDAAGVRLAGNLERWPAELADKPQGGTFTYGAGPNGHSAVGIPAMLPSGTRLLVARDLADQSRLINRIRQLFLIGFGLLSLTGLAGGLFASRLMLARVTQITDTGRTIIAGDLSRRIPLSSADDEFDDLAANLNSMLDRIEQLMSAMREVSDNIAHDLKTPLSRLRSRAEAAMRNADDEAHAEGLARVIEDADAIIQTFNALLLIARLEAGAVENSAETFDLTTLMHDVVELYEPVAEEAGSRLNNVTGRPVLVRANRQLIGQAIANLIDNAIKYGAPPAGRDAEISIALDANEKEIRISVGDRGHGIAPEDRARVAKRFVRLDQSRTRPGTGLGLSLVAAVAHLHGGRLVMEDNAPGLRIVIALPASIGGQKGAR